MKYIYTYCRGSFLLPNIQKTSMKKIRRRTNCAAAAPFPLIPVRQCERLWGVAALAALLTLHIKYEPYIFVYILVLKLLRPNVFVHFFFYSIHIFFEQKFLAFMFSFVLLKWSQLFRLHLKYNSLQLCDILLDTYYMICTISSHCI